VSELVSEAILLYSSIANCKVKTKRSDAHTNLIS
jgi:hypothetical protein